MGSWNPLGSWNSVISRFGFWSLGVALSGLLLLSGCGETVSKSSPAAGDGARRSQVDHLRMLTDYLQSDRRLDPTQFNRQVATLLDQWGRETTQAVTWSLDPLVGGLPENLRAAAGLNELDAMAFSPRDSQYLQQQAWAQSLVPWLSDRQRPADFRYLLFDQLTGLDAAAMTELRAARRPLGWLLQRLYPQLNEEEAASLASAWVAFDWTVRNVQLEPLRDPPTDEEVTLFALAEGDRSVPATMGVPGPGYTRDVDQVIRYGRGDAWQRGRVFLSLVDALGLDGAWLAAASDAQPGRAAERVWAIAVRIGEDAFLFEPRLGLPLPALQGDGIATWSQLRADPKLLRKLDVADYELSGRERRPLPYPVSEADLAQTIVLLDIAPAAVSKRMKLLEGSLTGAGRVRLARDPSAEAERWKTLAGITDVRLWDVPMLTPVYRRVYDTQVRFQNERIMAQHYFEEQCYEFATLQTGRHLAVLGRFEPPERFGRPGAKEVFQELRYTDEFITSLDTNEQRRQAFGLDVDGRMDLDTRKRYTQVLKDQLRMVRAVSALWMALAHFEMGDPGSAKQWLEQVAEYDTREVWTLSTRYNLARANESLLRYDEAIRGLRGGESPQEAGDALRARLLQQILDRSAKAEGEPNTESTEGAEGAEGAAEAEADRTEAGGDPVKTEVDQEGTIPKEAE